MEKSGKICILDEAQALQGWQGGELVGHGYEVFATSNLYQFLNYARETSPHLLMINVETGASSLLDMINADCFLNDIPVVIKAGTNFLPEKHERISHFLFSPYSQAEVETVAVSYCSGQQIHDVLLIDDYDATADSALPGLKRQALNCFEVHNLCAAQKYLQKNFPRGICVCLPYEECRKAEDVLQYDKIFYVENPARLKNIATLLN